LGGFFKRLFKDDTGNVSRMDEEDVINLVSRELTADNSILNDKLSVDTNRLPEIPMDNEAEAFKGFSGYLFYSVSNPGMVRKSNQDATFTGELKYFTRDKYISAGMGMVADGMGGLSMGEIASSTAIASVSTYLYARLTEYIVESLSHGLPHGQVVLGHISDSIKNANSIVLSKGQVIGDKIGTTFTCAFFIGSIAYFGHVGDSRAYIIDTKNGTIEKVTRDHSLVGRLVEMGNITEDEAKKHPRRNEIYRMLGLRDEIEVDTYYRILNKDSMVMIMSDGLWEFVDDSEMLDEVMKNNDISEVANILVEIANKNGGYDNISLVIAKPVE